MARKRGESLDTLSVAAAHVAKTGYISLTVASEQQWGRDSIGKGEVKSVRIVVANH